MKREISGRITSTLLMYVRENNNGSLGGLLDGLEVGEAFLSDANNWVSHAFLQLLYTRMIDILKDPNAVYKMALASERFESMGLLDRVARLLGNPKLIYRAAPHYNRLLKLNGDVIIHELGDNWVTLEDRYHNSAQKTRHDCDYTRAILAGIPTVFGLPPARVEEIECQVPSDVYGSRIWSDHPRQDSGGCLYRVQWQASGGLTFWKRLFRRRVVYRQAIEDLLDANQRIQEKYDEAKKLTEDLRISEKRYRLLAENVTDIIWTLDLATLKFDYLSPSVERIRGFTPEEAQALSLEASMAPASLDMVNGVLAEELAREREPGMNPNRTRTIEIEHSCKDGSYAWSEVTTTFIRDDQGKAVGIMGVSRDIAERKTAEAEARELASQLNRAQKMEAIGRLAGGVAHDLNNILSGLVGYPDLLLMELPADSPLRPTVETIQQSGQRAAAIVQDLLTLARRGVDVNEIVSLNAVITDYRYSPEFAKLQSDYPKICFDWLLGDDLMNIRGSRVHLSKVVMNLMANAAEAMPAGGRVAIATTNRYVDHSLSANEPIPEGEFICLSVTDEGVGIAAEDLKRIFEPFYTKKSMQRSGTGLGMTVIWATVKDHNGYIDVTSREGSGSCFEIYLPATREEIATSPAHPVLEDYVGDEAILVVDDVAEQREIARKMLSRLGYDIATASSGEEAVDYLKDRRVDLVVLDMIMPPGIDGLETYRRISAHHPGQKAVIASGFSENERVAELQRLGAGEYLRKPYTLEKIGMAVRRELDRP
ncbi:MAG: response regulator [Desulfobacterales bacterium]|nr:response regulator [Desulfobacterales bacterium]